MVASSFCIASILRIPSGRESWGWETGALGGDSNEFFIRAIFNFFIFYLIGHLREILHQYIQYHRQWQVHARDE